jgi:hypothetical protein
MYRDREKERERKRVSERKRERERMKEREMYVEVGIRRVRGSHSPIVESHANVLKQDCVAAL